MNLKIEIVSLGLCNAACGKVILTSENIAQARIYRDKKR